MRLPSNLFTVWRYSFLNPLFTLVCLKKKLNFCLYYSYKNLLIKTYVNYFLVINKNRLMNAEFCQIKLNKLL